MSTDEVLDPLSAPLRAALDAKGYTTLTPVQQAVLDPALAGKDLRITSQTGSGKTLAIGFAIRDLVEKAAEEAKSTGGWKPTQKPLVLVLAPTRELAQQSQVELQWLYAKLGAKVVAVTGGSGYRDELRTLTRGPAIIVGTPGRMLDHLTRGAIVTDSLGAVVLDEADRMLDLGFREDLEAIFSKMPKERRTHLVSATFPRGVQSLARAVQSDPAFVEGTRLGAANVDIDHVIHPVDSRDRLGAIINLLLVQPGARTLVFARTRAGVSELAQELSSAGFQVSVLSGDLDQSARNRALTAFKEQRTQVLVATDVAARGIDVQDIVRVIHAESPTDADAYTHRSGRTGRAGRKGISSLLVTPASVVQVTRLLRQAGVAHRFEPLPTADSIRRAADERMLVELTRGLRPGVETSAGDSILPPPNDEDGAPYEDPADTDERAIALAKQVLACDDPARAVARLLVRLRVSGGVEPRDVRSPMPKDRNDRGARDARGPRDMRDDRGPRDMRDDRGPRDMRGEDRGPRGGGFPDAPAERGYVRFHVSWGRRHGAEAHRVLAMVCRRGDISGRDVGAIRVDETFSFVDVAERVAQHFGANATQPDPRDARVMIKLDRGAPARSASPARPHAGGDAPPPRRPGPPPRNRRPPGKGK